MYMALNKLSVCISQVAYHNYRNTVDVKIGTDLRATAISYFTLAEIAFKK